MSRKLLIGAMVILAAGLLMSGCNFLEADKESDLLPTRNVGDTFKLFVDDIGPFNEIDETGRKTGRKGFYFDQDHNWYPGADNEDLIKDAFYQLSRPTAGIIALKFGDDGYAEGARPIAMAKIVAGQEHYEVPLESLREWVKEDNAIGYIPGQYKDDANKLVYFNRVTGEEFEAALTGKTDEAGFNFVSLGTVKVSVGGGNKSPGNSNPDYSFSEEDQGDYTPFRAGDVDDKCSGYNSICNDAQGYFEGGWSKTDCKQRLFSYFKHNGRVGSTYINCLKKCTKSNYKSCQADCQDVELLDENGCGGSYGPDVLDVFYYRQRDGENSSVDEGVNLTGDDRLAVFVEYADAEGNMAGGKMVVTVNDEEFEFPFPSGVNKSSLKEGRFIGFTFENPLPEGRVDFSIALYDGKLNGKYCYKEGDDTYDGYFMVNNPSSDSDDSQIDGVKRVFQFFEIFSSQINKYNIGKGFVDISSLDRSYFVELMEFDVAIVQGYIWSFLGVHDMRDFNISDLNNLIFTTPQDDRNTKYNDADDLTAYAFYIDQPMTSGLFTFYGDAGWNLYPKAPYGANDDQPFIRGDFATTEIYLPMTPYYGVELDYTGCGESCDYYLEFLYDFLHMDLAYYGNDYDKALADCRNDFRDDYWSCRVDCLNLADTRMNGCISVEDCMDKCPDAPTQKEESWCDGAKEIPLHLRMNIDPGFLKNCLYLKAIYGPEHQDAAHCEWTQDEIDLWEPIKLGVWFNDGLPGAYVELKWPQQDYTINLPFGPKIPMSFLSSGQADGMIQGQFYITAFTENQLWGSGFYAPDENNDAGWAWLMIYAYNWSGPSMQGWSLSTVSDNSITGFVNIFEPIIELNFGDLRALDDDNLDPNADEL